MSPLFICLFPLAFRIPLRKTTSSHPLRKTPGKPMVPKLALNSIPSRNNDNSMSSPSSPRRVQSICLEFVFFFLRVGGGVEVEREDWEYV